MQQRSCEEMTLLISKYVDDAASPEERDFVDLHVAACHTCSCKLTEYMEMAAIFAESPMFIPDVQVRQGVFHEIERLKEEERRSITKEAERSWFRPSSTVPAQVPTKAATFAACLMRATSPFAAAGLAVLAIFSLVLLNAQAPTAISPVPPVSLAETELVGLPPVPTMPAPISAAVADDFPTPISTKGAPIVTAPEPSASAPVRATATLGRPSRVYLANATPVLEEGLVSKVSTWHTVRDPAFGYTVSYPPNWWTQVRGSTRFFFPWSSGGTVNAPYYLELKVEANVKGVTAETANVSGACTIQPSGGKGLTCLRTNTNDQDNVYDEIYGFDSKNIYVLKLTVPRRNAQTYNDRWDAAQVIFTRMASTVSLASETSDSSDFSRVLFLNGSDLWSVGSNGQPAQPVTRGYGVRQFAPSTDLRSVAFTASSFSGDLWGRHLYLSHGEAGIFSEPVLIWSAIDIHDIAWYGDRQLLAIATSAELGFGIYSISLPLDGIAAVDQPLVTRLITKLSETMSGAKGLAVAPDRQLISFLAPVAVDKGTDIYVVRPDGSDLRKLISHTEPLSPVVGDLRVLPAENQAVKSYLWTDGRLEKAGYEFNLLFTSGNSSSPTLYRGGYLYSAIGATRGPLLDHNTLGVDDPDRLQIIHLAYSPSGRVALTGYYNDYRNRADYLAGLWTADLLNGELANVTSQPVPDHPNGIANLEWSPDGMDLIYRETLPSGQENWISSAYDGFSNFIMVKLNPGTGKRTVLYNSSER